MKKYAIITFLFGGYDLLREPLVVDDNFDYYCLTDDKELSSSTWNCVYIDEFDGCDLSGYEKTCRSKYSFYKYIPSGYEYWVNIDASMLIVGELTSFISRFSGYDIGLSIHPDRMKYLDEYAIWTNLRDLDIGYVDKFKEFAIDNGIDLDASSGLIECGLKVYRNCGIVKEFIDNVYMVLSRYCNFKDLNDQCYFTVTFSKYEDRMNVLFFYRQLYCDSRYFNIFRHKTNERWHNSFTKETNNKLLFNKVRELNEF